MTVEAIPIRFDSARANNVEDAAKVINEQLQRGTYVGHIAVSEADHYMSSKPRGIDGIVLLIDTVTEATS